MGHNPFDGVSRFSEGEGSVRFLSEEERERLLAETAKDPTKNAEPRSAWVHG